MSPDVSVISPVLNEGMNIERTLASMAAQTGCLKEHILTDGGSTDGTLPLLERYAASAPYPVRLLRNVGGGVYNALNAGIAEARGRYLAILHGGDAFSSPDVLGKAVRALSASDAELLYGDLHYANRSGRTVRRYSGRPFRPERMTGGLMPPHPTVIAARRLADAVGPYDTSFRISADFDWLLRAILLHRARTLYLPVDMVAMATGGASGRWSSRLWRHNSEKYRSLRSHGFRICPLRLLMRYLYL